MAVTAAQDADATMRDAAEEDAAERGADGGGGEAGVTGVRALTRRRSGAATEALLLELVRRHAEELLRIAGQHSLCSDDAHDAYQRGLEQFLKCGHRLERATAHKWLFTVTKREALMIRAARNESVCLDEVDVNRLEELHDASPEDRALDVDAVARGAEALRALKPQQLRALWLRADGRSYAEIQAATGWTYTKVNRSLREGRRAYLRRCAELEAGTTCAGWRDALAELAAGEAGAAQLIALRPHLRRCAACRATLRGLHASRASVATVLPPGLVGIGAAGPADADGPLGTCGAWLGRAHDAVLGGLARAYEVMAGPLHERAMAGAVKWQAAAEVVSSGKVAAVAASTVALAGGGAVIVHEAPGADPGPPAHRAAAPHRTRRTSSRAAIAVPAAQPARRSVGGAAVRPAPALRRTTARRSRPASNEFAASATRARGSASATRVAKAEFGDPGSAEPVVGTAAVAGSSAPATPAIPTRVASRAAATSPVAAEFGP